MSENNKNYIKMFDIRFLKSKLDLIYPSFYLQSNTYSSCNGIKISEWSFLLLGGGCLMFYRVLHGLYKSQVRQERHISSKQNASSSQADHHHRVMPAILRGRLRGSQTQSLSKLNILNLEGTPRNLTERTNKERKRFQSRKKNSSSSSFSSSRRQTSRRRKK